MVNTEIEQYRYNLHLYFNALGCVAAFGFSVLQLIRGDHLTGLISVIGGVYFVIVIYILIRQHHYLWKGRGFVLFIPITMLNIINLHPEYGIYWAYVGAISFFLLLEFNLSLELWMCKILYKVNDVVSCNFFFTKKYRA